VLKWNFFFRFRIIPQKIKEVPKTIEIEQVLYYVRPNACISDPSKQILLSFRLIKGKNILFVILRSKSKKDSHKQCSGASHWPLLCVNHSISLMSRIHSLLHLELKICIILANRMSHHVMYVFTVFPFVNIFQIEIWNFRKLIKHIKKYIKLVFKTCFF